MRIDLRGFLDELLDVIFAQATVAGVVHFPDELLVVILTQGFGQGSIFG